jgi:hypothetical protein
MSRLLPLIALFTAAAAQSFSPRSLVASLLASSPTTASLSSVYGQRLELLPYQLTLLANETHAQATFVMEGDVDEVGWIALVRLFTRSPRYRQLLTTSERNRDSERR